jgi:type I restriction enzyme S subunit
MASLERVQRNLKRYRASVLKAAVEGRLVPTEAELARADGREYEPASVLLERILAERRRRWEGAELAKMKAKGKVPKNDKWKAKYVEPDAPDTSELLELPEGWGWVSPAQFFSWSSGEFLPRKAQKTGIYPVLGGNGINGFHDKPLFNSPTLVIGRVGANCGNVHLTDGPSWITDNAIYASEGSDLVVLPYWHFAISMNNLNANAGGTGQPYVNQRHLNNLVIPLAPEAEQVRIVKELERLDSIIVRISMDERSASTRIRRLRQSILKWAFEGRLVDQDPNDEPAAVLLERIRAERAAGNGKKQPRSRLVNTRSASA